MQRIKKIIIILVFGLFIGTIPISAAQSYKTCSNEKQAAEYIKNALVAHKKKVQFLYDYDKCSSSMYVKLLNLACSQGNVGREGDYLYRTLSGLSAYVTKKSNNKGLVTYELKYLTTVDQERQVDEKVAQIVSNLKLSGKSDYDKIKKIYEYVCSSVTYDSSYTKFTAYSAIFDGTAVCEGYALLLHRLLIEAGLQAKIIPGDVNGKHMWNIVKLGNRWYNLDSTADAGQKKYHFFLCCDDDMNGYKREYNYTTATFYKNYPMAKTCYQRECINALSLICKKINKLTYKTVDDKKVTVKKNKQKVQVLFYYIKKDALSTQTLKQLMKLDWVKKKDVRVLAVEVGRAKKTEVSKFSKQFKGKRIQFAYDTSYDAYNALCTNFYQVKKTKKASYPIVMVLNGKNEVRYLTMGANVSPYVTKAVEKVRKEQ